MLIPKPTTTYSSIDAPSSFIFPIWSQITEKWSEIDEKWSEYVLNIYADIDKPTTIYSSIDKPL